MGATSIRKTKEVFLLGAGFSKAVSDCMPTMRDLPPRIRELYNGSLPENIDRMIGSDVEAALSYLAQSKPWQREAENLRDRALFLDLSYVIGQAIDQATDDAIAMMATEPPPWLSKLVKHWHRNRTHVLTLNYDTIVERVAADLFAQNSDGNNPTCLDLYPKYISRSRGLGGFSNYEEPKTFRMLKLHGSANWYSSGRQNRQSDSIYCTIPHSGPSGMWRSQAEARESHEAQSVADRVPFIVPPVLEKASLLEHESICALWGEARAALEKADKLVVLGYSLPDGDWTMRHFLRTALANKDTQIEIVDRAAELADRYRAKLSRNEDALPARQQYSGDNCIPAFATALPEQPTSHGPGEQAE